MVGKWFKRALIGGAIVFVLVIAGFLAWTQISRYPAAAQATELVVPAVKSSQGWYVFKPAQPNGAGLVIYPGALVDPVAYAPLARAIADQGVLVVITPMPLELAVFGINSADPVIAAFPQVERWAIAGHSLGGSMAAQHIANHAGNLGKIKGLVLWASYAPNGTDLSRLPIQAVSIFGSNDRVMKSGMSDQERLQGLPPGTPLVVIEGGNHAGFGDYGPQSGDGVATIPAAEQQRQAAAATMRLIDSMDR